MMRPLLRFGLGFCLVAALPLAAATASEQLPDSRPNRPSAPYGQFADTPFGRFLHYLEEGEPEEARRAFSQLDTFEDRYRALTQAVYPFTYAPGVAELVSSCADSVLRRERDPHRRAAIYRVLAQMSYRLKDIDAALGNAQKAVLLNPDSPWGWFWLAEVYRDRGYYAAEAVARKRELSLFTGNTDNDSFHRGHVYHRLGLLYRTHFRQPETAISYYCRELSETARLPADENYATYRVARCSGAFMNILFTMVQDLHDLPRAQQTLEWAAAVVPSFPSEPLDRERLLRLGLHLPQHGGRPCP